MSQQISVTKHGDYFVFYKNRHEIYDCLVAEYHDKIEVLRSKSWFFQGLEDDINMMAVGET